MIITPVYNKLGRTFFGFSEQDIVSLLPWCSHRSLRRPSWFSIVIFIGVVLQPKQPLTAYI